MHKNHAKLPYFLEFLHIKAKKECLAPRYFTFFY